MSHVRYDNHKYARLNNREMRNQKSFSEDEENEEIDLGTQHRLRQSTESDDNRDKIVGSKRHQNGYLDHHSDGTQQYASDIPETGGTSITLRDRLNDARLMQMAICSLLTILLYLLLSICLTFYQKALIKELKLPLSIVSYHLVLKLIIAAVIRAIYKGIMGKSRIQLDCRTSVRKMAPTGLASGIDIGFSNWALELVSVSLYTMTKSSTIVFILIFAIILGLEKKVTFALFHLHIIASKFFTELVFGIHCGPHCHRPIYVHLQIHTIRAIRIRIYTGGITKWRHSLEFGTICNAKIKAGPAQPH